MALQHLLNLYSFAAQSISTGSGDGWLIALIMGGFGLLGTIVTVVGGHLRSHSRRIDGLEAELNRVKRQQRAERMAVHRWWQEVIRYLRELPNGDDIVQGLPPMPVRVVRYRRKGRGE